MRGHAPHRYSPAGVGALQKPPTQCPRAPFPAEGKGLSPRDLAPGGPRPSSCVLAPACLSSPCLNGGTCHLIVATGTTVCACPPGHAGRLCNIGESRGWALGPGGTAWGPGSPWHPPPPTVPAQSCFVGNGTEYRGVASTAASGLSCLAWNSDLLYQELHVDSVAAAALLGLGPHAYCRSALAWPSGQGPFWGRELLTAHLRAGGPREKSQAGDQAAALCPPAEPG